IALIANKFDLKYVMDQVGHGDSTMTMDVYSQLQKRYKRSHGVNFDRIVSEASGQVKVLPLAGAPIEAASPPRGAQQKPAWAAAGPGPRPGTRSRAPRQPSIRGPPGPRHGGGRQRPLLWRPPIECPARGRLCLASDALQCAAAGCSVGRALD